MVVITPGKKTCVRLLFSNDSEYDLPLSVKLSFSLSADVDKTQFDVTVPAEGNTEIPLTFSKQEDCKMFMGTSVGEIEITDRIFDSKTVYEFDVICEAAYKCADPLDGFSPSNQALYSRNGTFFANSDETVFMEIPLSESAKYRLHIISGRINGYENDDIIALKFGLNKLCFEMQKDGSFEFLKTENDEKIYTDTINTKYFL